MPKGRKTAKKPAVAPAAPVIKQPAKPPHCCDTNESRGYLDGLHQEFHEQLAKYIGLVHHMMELQARVELAEKNLCVTRDHFALAIKKTEGTLPRDWSDTFAAARFVGVRLSDACTQLLQEHKRLSPKALLNYLNHGPYRFRTNAPLREIHGALLRQPSVVRAGRDWVWTGEQRSLPALRAVEKPKAIADDDAVAGA